MKNLFAGEGTGSILRNESALLPEFAPAELLHRESQLPEIARALKP